MRDTLTTAEAARIIGVAPTSLKRWTRAGQLACIRTAGNHRRFERREVERFIRDRAAPSSRRVGSTDGWLEAILGNGSSNGSSRSLTDALADARATAGSWHRVADELAPVCRDIELRQQDGQLSTVDAKVASERLRVALAMVGDSLLNGGGGLETLLVATEDDEHTLELSLSELVLREVDCYTRFAGAGARISDVVREVQAGRTQMLLLSASCLETDTELLMSYIERLGEVCAQAGVVFAIGGGGAWPDPPRYGWRFQSFAELSRGMDQLTSPR